MAATSTPTVVKVDFNGELRRIKLEGDKPTFSGLESKVRSAIGLEESKKKVALQYLDSDDEWVTISSDGELHEALSSSRCNKTSKRVLRLQAKVKAKPSKQPAPATATEAPSTSSQAPVAPTAPIVLAPNATESLKERKMRIREACLAKKAAREKFIAERLAIRQARAAGATAPATIAETLFKGRGIARFVKHVTYEDDTPVPAGSKFTKIWRFRNDSTSTWPAGTHLMFVGKGDQLGGPNTVALKPAAPGETVDVSVELEAPLAPGRYAGYWRLASAEGRKFGQRVWVQIVVVSTSSSSSSDESEEDTSPVEDKALPVASKPTTESDIPASAQDKKEIRLLERQRRIAEKLKLRAEQREARLARQSALKAAKQATKKQMKLEAKKAPSADNSDVLAAPTSPSATAVSAAPAAPASPSATTTSEYLDWEPFMRRLNELGLTITSKPKENLTA